MIGKRLGFARPFSQDWLLPEWNDALLRHFFSARPGDLRPINRLYVTAEELKKSAGATDVSAGQARGAIHFDAASDDRHTLAG